MLDILVKIKSWYERLERFNPIVFFFGGFTWDSLTLKRIDQMFDNLVLLTYLILLGVMIIITALAEHGKIKHRLLMKVKNWAPLALQFFLGGLFSAYVIFYFQSASFTKTAIFLGILVILLIANEFLESRLTNIYLLLGVYFLACFSFFIFFIPVLIKVLNVFTFITGGLVSLLLVLGVTRYLYKKKVLTTQNSYACACLILLGLYGLINFLYFSNRIPPVPLSLKFGGIYHHASKRQHNDDFVLKYEKPEWYQLFRRSDTTYRYARGDTVSCFTAVFAPTKLTTRIYHHWQKYFPQRQAWVPTDRLGFKITGYRDGGYRGVTRKQNISPGKWRVDVETEAGILLGRIGFHLEEVEQKVALKTILR
ncbi:MAG: DUF2914 domain-containing protein [bacterium]